MGTRVSDVGKHPLVEFSWDEMTGIATLVYERPGDSDVAVYAEQPMHPKHEGWAELGQRTMRVNPNL